MFLELALLQDLRTSRFSDVFCPELTQGGLQGSGSLAQTRIVADAWMDELVWPVCLVADDRNGPGLRAW